MGRRRENLIEAGRTFMEASLFIISVVAIFIPAARFSAMAGTIWAMLAVVAITGGYELWKVRALLRLPISQYLAAVRGRPLRASLLESLAIVVSCVALTTLR